MLEYAPRKVSEISRKIIQITATAVDDIAEADILYALCDDGTVWWTRPLWAGEHDTWRKIHDIPQEENALS